MTPDRRKMLAELATTVALRYRDAKGEPAPHELPISVAEAIVIRLDQVWGLPPRDVARLAANVNAGIER